MATLCQKVIVDDSCRTYTDVRVSIRIPDALLTEFRKEIVGTQYAFAESWFGNIMRKFFYVFRLFSSTDFVDQLVVFREICMYANRFRGTKLGLRSLENNLLELYFYWENSKTAFEFYTSLPEYLAQKCSGVTHMPQVQIAIGSQIYSSLDTELQKQMTDTTSGIWPVDIVADVSELEDQISKKAGWFMASRHFPMLVNLLHLASNIAPTEKGVLILEKLYLELHLFWSSGSIEAHNRFTGCIFSHSPHALATG